MLKTLQSKLWIKVIPALAITIASVFGTASAQAQVSGEVKCNRPGKSNWGFKVASAVGYLNLTSGDFQMKFFADSLNAAELKYYVGDQAGYADEGKEFEKIPSREARLKAADPRSMVIWGEIKENSIEKLDTLPAVHTKEQLTGINLSSCSNLGGMSVSIRSEEEVREVIQAFNFPTTAGVHTATIEVKYVENRSPGEETVFVAKANATFYVFKTPE